MEVVFEMLCHWKCWHFALNHFTVIYVFYCGKNKLSNWDSQEDALCLLLSQSKCHVNTRFCSFMELQDTWYCWLFLPQTPPHLLWCGCQVLVLPLHRTSTFFLTSSSASLSFLIGTFWHFISTYSPWVNSSTLRDNYPRSTPQPWSRSELQILSSLPMDEGFHLSSAMLLLQLFLDLRNKCHWHHYRKVQLWRADSKPDLSSSTSLGWTQMCSFL